MEPIYHVINTLTGIWVFAFLIIFAFSGGITVENDRFSMFFLMITFSVSFAVIRSTTNAGESAYGTFFWGFPVINYFGFFLLFVGVLIQFLGIFTLKKQWSGKVVIFEDHQLIDTGIYKYIRHPIYTALLLEFLGFGFALANWTAVLILLTINALSLTYRIYVEEKALKNHFGDAYINYARKTKRIIPGIF